MEKLICVDIDGTILPFDGKINNEILEVLHSNEYKFLIATGRPVNEVRDFGIDIDCIASNGAEIVKDNKLISRRVIEKKLVLEFGNELINSVGNLIICTTRGRFIYKNTDFNKMAESIVSAVHGEVIESEVTRLLPKLQKCDGFFTSINEVLSLDGIEVTKFESATYSHLERFLSYLNNEDVSAFSSVKGYVEVVPSNVNKAESIKQYIEEEQYQVFAIGDGDNDIEMFEISDISFAMANGTKKLKRIATHQTSSVDDDGFLKAIDFIRNNY